MYHVQLEQEEICFSNLSGYHLGVKFSIRITRSSISSQHEVSTTMFLSYKEHASCTINLSTDQFAHRPRFCSVKIVSRYFNLKIVCLIESLE